MKAITSPPPPTNIVDFPSWKPSRCAFPRPYKPTPRRTLIDCHVFEARDWADRSNLSTRSQFNEALNPPPAIIPKKCTPQNAAASQSPGRFRPPPADPRLIVVSLRSASGRTHGNGPPGHQLAMTSTPLKHRIFPLISVATNRAAVPSPGRFAEH